MKLPILRKSFPVILRASACVDLESPQSILLASPCLSVSFQCFRCLFKTHQETYRHVGTCAEHEDDFVAPPSRLYYIDKDFVYIVLNQRRWVFISKGNFCCSLLTYVLNSYRPWSGFHRSFNHIKEKKSYNFGSNTMYL